MNTTQAENLRILIRHIETKVTGPLNMSVTHPWQPEIGCAMCEARRGGLVRTGFTIETLSRDVYGLDHRDSERLFGGFLEIGDRTVFRPTTQEWGTKARKVLAENGYSMDEPKPAQTFENFMAATLKPVQIAVLPSGEWA